MAVGRSDQTRPDQTRYPSEVYVPDWMNTFIGTSSPLFRRCSLTRLLGLSGVFKLFKLSSQSWSWSGSWSPPLTAVAVLRVLLLIRTSAGGKRSATGGGGAMGVSGARLSLLLGSNADAESPAPGRPCPCPTCPCPRPPGPVVNQPGPIPKPTGIGSLYHIAGADARLPIPSGPPSGSGSIHGVESLRPHGIGLKSSAADG
jgi:hypothetical protein